MCVSPYRREGGTVSDERKCNHCCGPIVEGQKHVCADHCRGCAELRDEVEGGERMRHIAELERRLAGEEGTK
jgi:hypothetical protein